MNSKVESSSSSLSSRRNSQRKRKRRRSNKSVGNECNTDKEQKGMQSLWFWSNYYKAFMWQHKHQLELWKTYARELAYEKMYLLQELNRLKKLYKHKDVHGYENSTLKTFTQNKDCLEEKFEPETEEEEASEDEEIEFEVSEEMIQFFEQSIRHKMEMKQLKEKEVEQLELDVKELKEAHEVREKEMKLLYGEGSCMIIGMETAVQLSFDKYCDLKSPPYWPNIPLNL